jgi:hypothetical protein
LVDPRGAQLTLHGPPVASPNGRSFAAAGDDVSGEELNGLEIADYRGGVFNSLELIAPAAFDPYWIDDDTLELKILPSPLSGEPDSPARKSSDWKTVRVVRDGKGWKLLPPKP